MIQKMFKALALAAVMVGLAACSGTTNNLSTEGKSVGGTLAEIFDRDKIIVGVKTDYAPYGFIDQNGKNAGLEIDIAYYLAEAFLGAEDKVEFVRVVASNRIELLKQGKIDLVLATMTDTTERRQIIDFSENYYSAGTGLMTRKDNDVSSWDDLQGKRVCGIQGSFYNKDLSEMGIEMVNFPDTAEAYIALKDGRCIGFAYDNTAIIGKLLESEWAEDWHQPLPVILAMPWGMGVRKGDVELLDAMNQAILKMEAEGFIVEGEQRWNIPATAYAQERMERAQRLLAE